MNAPSRREFFACAAAATLAYALPVSAQTKKDQAKKSTVSNSPSIRPLVVDVMGPMAFRWTRKKFELWTPDLTTEKNLNKPGITPHQAGITTTVDSIELHDGDYKITGPSDSQGIPTVCSPPGTEVYQPQVREITAPKKYISMSLPNPHFIVVLDPVVATISGSAPKTSGSFAVGLRLFYDQANKPELWYPDGHSETIQFYACELEIQTNMLIGYVPCDFRDPGHVNAKASFHEVSLLCGLDLQVEFGDERRRIGFRDCKSPAMGLGGS